jgi:hypothetical protein
MNGVEPTMLLNRRNGTDGQSVIHFAGPENHNNIRVIATQTAYGPDGKLLFWNLYSELDKNGFTPDAAGQGAFEGAYNYPIYTFPSTTIKGGDRQSPVIDTADSYFQKNPLGLGVVMTVEFKAATTKEDADYLAALGQKNGLSVDGTPVIRTTQEINQLILRNLVWMTTRGASSGDEVPFMVGKVIEFPTSGAIANDSFLVYVKDGTGKPIESEAFFITAFECIKNGGCK